MKRGRPEKGEDRFKAAICIDRDYDGMDSGIIMTEPQQQKCPYRALWCSVIQNAIYDATANTHSYSVAMDRRKAVSWLRGENNYRDLFEVCEMAGVNAQSVVSWARKAFPQKSFLTEGEINEAIS